MIKGWVKSFTIKKAVGTVLSIAISFSYVLTVNNTYQTNNYIKDLEKRNMAVVVLEIDRRGNLIAMHHLSVEQADSLIALSNKKDMISIPLYPFSTIKVDVPKDRRRRK